MTILKQTSEKARETSIGPNEGFKPILDRFETLAHALLRSCCRVLGVDEYGPQVIEHLSHQFSEDCRLLATTEEQQSVRSDALRRASRAQGSLREILKAPPEMAVQADLEEAFDARDFIRAIETATSIADLKYDLEITSFQEARGAVVELSYELEDFRRKFLDPRVLELIEGPDREIVLKNLDSAFGAIQIDALSDVAMPLHSMVTYRRELYERACSLEDQAEKLLFGSARAEGLEGFAKRVIKALKEEYPRTYRNEIEALFDPECGPKELEIVRAWGQSYLSDSLERLGTMELPTEALRGPFELMLDACVLRFCADKLPVDDLSEHVTDLQIRIESVSEPL